MKTVSRNFLRLAVLLILIAGAFGLHTTAAQAASCTPTVSFDLYAIQGSITLAGQSINIWGYSLNSGGPATLPGPVLTVNEGDCVGVTLHNNLAETTSMLFQGQEMIPDLTGAAPGGSATYAFSASHAGTFLYEAGLLSNAQHQVAMGLYGAMIIVPAGFPGQAYASPNTAFTVEAPMVLSEIDPLLNNSANPAGFDMRSYHPQYFLINGQVYPDTTAIPAIPGDTVLLRYVNAGLQAHSMGSLGLNQTTIAMDGFPFLYSHTLIAESIAPGQTSDVMITVPAWAPDGSKFAIFDNTLFLHNGGTSGVGGMLTFINVSTTPGGGDTVGPTTSGVILSPSTTNGSVLISVSAQLSDAASGNSNIQAAEYYIDNTSGTAVALSAFDGAFDSPVESVAGSIPTSSLAALATGTHTVYVRGQDTIGNWGAFASATFVLDKTGPLVSGITLTPASSNGSVNVALSGTADDRSTGGSVISSAQYSIDGGAPAVVNVSPSGAQIANLSASIPAAVVAGLSEGSHTVTVTAVDAFGNSGAGTGSLVVDKTGAVTSNVVANPVATNGTQGYNSTTPAVRITASFADSLSKVSGAEAFIDTVGQNGKGIIFIASDGVFNSPSENGYTDIPLSTIKTLSEGPHTLYVHGKDSAGNWGAFATVTINYDKTAPGVSNVTATPNPTNGTADNNTSFTLSAVATDPDPAGAAIPSGIAAAEWYEGTDPGAGRGNAMTGTFGGSTVNVSTSINFMARGWAAGNHTLYVRAKDGAGSWSASVSVGVNVVLPNSIFSDGFESGSFSGWSSTGGTAANISVVSGGAQAGTYRMQANISGGTSGFVQDNTPFADASYHARFYFNPNSYTTGNGGNPATVTIFSGLNSANTVIFTVDYRRSNSTGYQVRLSVLRAGGTTTTSWYTITNSAWNAIEVSWQSATSASISFYTGGALRQTLTGLNTSAYTLDTARLGPQGTLPGTSGTVYFDSFVSTRRTIVGP